MDTTTGMKIGFICIGLILLMIGAVVETTYRTPSREYTVGLCVTTIILILHSM